MIRCKVFSAFVIAGIVLTFANASAQSITGTKAKAEAGDTLAQHALGEMYESGQGVPRDSAEAAKWYRKAANQGHARAQYYLGVMHTQGRGVSRDDGEAVKLFRMAAEQGYGPAQGHLGRMFHLGKGVSQNFVLAHKWYNLAAIRLTGKLRDSAIDLRKSVAKNMTREQLAEAQRLAREWMEQHPNATNFRGSELLFNPHAAVIEFGNATGSIFNAIFPKWSHGSRPLVMWALVAQRPPTVLKAR